MRCEVARRSKQVSQSVKLGDLCASQRGAAICAALAAMQIRAAPALLLPQPRLRGLKSLKERAELAAVRH